MANPQVLPEVILEPCQERILSTQVGVISEHQNVGPKPKEVIFWVLYVTSSNKEIKYEEGFLETSSLSQLARITWAHIGKIYRIGILLKTLPQLPCFCPFAFLYNFFWIHCFLTISYFFLVFCFGVILGDAKGLLLVLYLGLSLGRALGTLCGAGDWSQVGSDFPVFWWFWPIFFTMFILPLPPLVGINVVSTSRACTYAVVHAFSAVVLTLSCGTHPSYWLRCSPRFACL